MRTKVLNIALIIILIYQLYFYLEYVISIRPMSGGPGSILTTREIDVIKYFFIGIIGIVIFLINRSKLYWFLLLCAGVTILLGIYTLLDHSPFYENQGMLNFKVTTPGNSNRSPIKDYGLDGIPPSVKTLFSIIVYNTGITIWMVLRIIRKNRI